MRKFIAAAAAFIVLVTIGGFAQAPQQKGGGDITGSYDLVTGWPQNWCGQGFQIRIHRGHLGRNPGSRDRVCPRVPPGARGAGRPGSGAQRVGLRLVPEGSSTSSAEGSHRQHRRSQRPADRVVGAAQQSVRPSAPRSREPLRSRTACLARGRRRACDLQVHARWQDARADDWHAQHPGQ